MSADLGDLGVADGNLDAAANAKIARAVSAVFPQSLSTIVSCSAESGANLPAKSVTVISSRLATISQRAKRQAAYVY